MGAATLEPGSRRPGFISSMVEWFHPIVVRTTVPSLAERSEQLELGSKQKNFQSERLKANKKALIGDENFSQNVRKNIRRTDLKQDGGGGAPSGGASTSPRALSSRTKQYHSTTRLSQTLSHSLLPSTTQ